MKKIDKNVIQLIKCPDCKGNISYSNESLICNKCSRKFIIYKENLFNLMPKTISEKKKRIMEWWEENKPDLDHYVVGSEGVEQGNWEYFTNTDRKYFKWCHPWGNSRYPILHKWIDYRSLSDKRVLEIGCGVGIMFEQFLGMGVKEVHAIELNKTSAALTQKRTELNKFSGQGYVYQADAENLPFKDNSFDCILSYGVLHHSENTQKAIDEVHRVLKPNGNFLVMVYNKDSINYWWHIFFLWGILKGKFLKMTEAQLTAARTDRNYKGGNPKADFISKKELKKMFNKFTEVNLHPTGDINQIKLLPYSKLPIAKFLVPSFIAQKLVNKYGKLIHIIGRK